MIQELHAGDRQIPASGWNEMRAAVQGITPGQQQYQSGRLNPVYVTIKNTTGADLPAFAAVKISGMTYSSRTVDEFREQGLKNGVELNGATPASPGDTVAITQAACKDGDFVKAIINGATPAFVAISTASGNEPKYAAPAAGQITLQGTNTVTNIKVLSSVAGANNTAIAYVLIDATDDRERFKLSYSPSNNSTVAKKGDVYRVVLTNNGWVVQTSSNSSAKYVLAVCQDNVPDNYEGDFYMPFYTPEQNYGIIPNVAVSSGITSNPGDVGRRGVGAGDHEYSNKRLDYAYQHGQYTYEPRFTYSGQAVNAGDASNPAVGIVIEGHTYSVTFPTRDTYGGNPQMAPDVYAGDVITVLVEEKHSGDYGATVTAIDYPVDFAVNSSIVVEDTMILGRGWDDDFVPNTNFKFAIKVKTNALI